ncbi:MAG: DUF4349 domain-containing protein [Deltaproteobacteria bacterium]|nr:DUF4349 domain-containing protein [Deltaproteobacteria bacterium]
MTKRLPTLAVILSLVAAQTGCAASELAPKSPPAHAAAAGYPADATAAAAPAPESAPMQAPASPAPAAPPPGAPAQPGAPVAKPGAPSPPPKPADARSAKSAGPTTRAAVIIYQGDLKMMADEDAIPKTIDKIVDVAESLGGHIAGRKDQSVQIKVPSASFREAMTKIEAIGGVTNRSVTADDVSEEFHDLEVRLTNLRSTRTRLQEFMGKAASIQDMLTVERELERVAQEIDRIEGRLEFLRTRAAMSVISIALTPKPKSAAPVVVTTPPPPPPRNLELPIPWVDGVGIDPLLSLKK